MAIAVIGGLLVSTFLSLVFVPSFFTIMDDASIVVAKVFRWLVKPNAVDEPGQEHTASVYTLPERMESLPIAAE